MVDEVVPFAHAPEVLDEGAQALKSRARTPGEVGAEGVDLAATKFKTTNSNSTNSREKYFDVNPVETNTEFVLNYNEDVAVNNPSARSGKYTGKTRRVDRPVRSLWASKRRSCNGHSSAQPPQSYSRSGSESHSADDHLRPYNLTLGPSSTTTVSRPEHGSQEC